METHHVISYAETGMIRVEWWTDGLLEVVIGDDVVFVVHDVFTKNEARRVIAIGFMEFAKNVELVQEQPT